MTQTHSHQDFSQIMTEVKVNEYVALSSSQTTQPPGPTAKGSTASMVSNATPSPAGGSLIKMLIEAEKEGQQRISEALESNSSMSY